MRPPTDDEGPDLFSESTCVLGCTACDRKEPAWCPDWGPWFACGLFGILAVTFILLWSCQKKDIQALRRQAPALVNYIMEERPMKGCICAFPANKHSHDVTVDFVYLTGDMKVSVTKDIDKQYTFESAVAGGDAALLGTAVLDDTNVSLYTRLTSSRGEGKNLDSEDYRSAYLRNSLQHALPQILEQLSNRKPDDKIHLVMDYKISEDEGCNWTDRKRIIYEWAIGSKDVLDAVSIGYVLPDRFIPSTSFSSISFDTWMDFLAWYEKTDATDPEDPFKNDEIGMNFLKPINAIYKAKFDSAEWTSAKRAAKDQRVSERQITKLEKKIKQAKDDEKTTIENELTKEKEKLGNAKDTFSKARQAAEAKDSKREAKDIEEQKNTIEGKDGKGGLLKELSDALSRARKHYKGETH